VGGNVRGKYPRGEMSGGNVWGEMSGGEKCPRPIKNKLGPGDYSV